MRPYLEKTHLKRRAGGVAQVVERLCYREVLSSNPGAEFQKTEIQETGKCGDPLGHKINHVCYFKRPSISLKGVGLDVFWISDFVYYYFVFETGCHM
jgi:hypothetical protein